jgi:hypothetical protein
VGLVAMRYGWLWVWVCVGLVAVRVVVAPVVADLAWGDEGGFVLP